MQPAADRLRSRLLNILQEVVANEQMRPASGDGATAPHCIEAPARGRVEASQRRGITAQPCLREDRLIQRVGHEVAHAAADIVAQILSISREDYAALGMA